MDHHANMKFTHKCVDGVDLEMEFFTFEAKRITQKDYDAAHAVDMLLSGESSGQSN
jgi:pterin-4a-carbinolamine dehydratase